MNPTSLHPFWSAATLTLTGVLAWGISLAEEPEQKRYSAPQAASGRIVEWPSNQTKRPKAVIYDQKVNSSEHWTFEPIPEDQSASNRRKSPKLSLPVVQPVVWEELPQSLVNPWEPWTWHELYEPIVEAPDFAVEFPEPKIEPIPDPFGDAPPHLLAEMRGKFGSVTAGSSFSSEETVDEFAEMVRKAQRESVVAFAEPKVPSPQVYPGFSSCGFAYQHRPVVVPAPRVATSGCCYGENCACGSDCGCSMTKPKVVVQQYPISVPPFPVMFAPESANTPLKVTQLRESSQFLDGMAFNFERAGLYEQADQLRAVAQNMRVTARELLNVPQSHGESVAKLQPLPPMSVPSTPIHPRHLQVNPVSCEDLERIEMEEIFLPVEFPSQPRTQEVTRWFDWLGTYYESLQGKYQQALHSGDRRIRRLPSQPVVETVSFVEVQAPQRFRDFDLNTRIRKMQRESEELREYFDTLGTLVDYGIPARFRFASPPPAEEASADAEPNWTPLIGK